MLHESQTEQSYTVYNPTYVKYPEYLHPRGGIQCGVRLGEGGNWSWGQENEGQLLNGYRVLLWKMGIVLN